jgi:hypothetical protein
MLMQATIMRKVDALSMDSKKSNSVLGLATNREHEKK